MKKGDGRDSGGEQPVGRKSGDISPPAANPRRARRHRRRNLPPKLSDFEYRDMLKWQGDGCAICERPPKRIRLSVDHDHKTGQIRGLLCNRCNRGLVWFSDNWEYLDAAAEYIRRAQRREVLKKFSRV